MNSNGCDVTDDNGKVLARVVADVPRPDLLARQFADSDEAFRQLRRLYDRFKNMIDDPGIERLLVTNCK